MPIPRKVARAFSPSLELSSAAWERPRIRRSTIEMSCPTARAAKPNCPTSFAVKPVRSSASFTRVPYSPRLFAASNADAAIRAEHCRAGGDRDAKGTKGGEHGRDCALRPLERILHELADTITERSDGFGLLPQCLFGVLGRLDRESFARGLLLNGDHLLVR